MKVAFYVIGFIFVYVLGVAVVAIPAMFIGNSFLIDVGLQTAEYSSWFWFMLFFGGMFAGNAVRK